MNANRIHPEIAHGANICAKLKHIFFPKQKWTESISNDVARKLSGIKKKAREFYACDSNMEALEKISTMSITDLQELCEVTFNEK